MNGLRKIVIERGIKIYRLAKDLNVPRSTVRSWLAGSVPREKHLTLLVNYFHAKPEYIVFGSNQYAPTLKDEVMRIAEELEEYATERPQELQRLKQVIDLFMSRDIVFSKKKETIKSKILRHKAGSG